MKDGKFLILCVDDDPDILDTLKVVIESAGYLFVGGRSAEEGLRKYKEVAPDFVMVDLMMEEVDAGTGLVKELKLLGNAAPVYMLSSVGDEMNRMTDWSDLGLSGVFQKPIDFNVLRMTLKAKLK